MVTFLFTNATVVLEDRLLAAGITAARAHVLAEETNAVLAPAGDQPTDGDRESRFAAWTEVLDALAGERFDGHAFLEAARARGAALPTVRHWGSALLLGGLMFLLGNGGVVWSQQHIPSGVTALLVAAVPLWMALLQGLDARSRPGGTTRAGSPATSPTARTSSGTVTRSTR